jgi:hypothetical protein
MIGLLIGGLLLGSGGLALGTYLASGNNGWPSALWFSAVGLVGAPLAALSWTSRRSSRRGVMAGVALMIGAIATMGLLFDLTRDASQISFAWTQVPFAVAGWLLIWFVWLGAAVMRLLLFKPPKLRQRLSSHRGART